MKSEQETAGLARALEWVRNVRGRQVDLERIRAALVQHPAVRDAVVDNRRLAAREKGLIAYYLAEPGVEVAGESLRAHMLGHLPEYMVPGGYMRLDAFPRAEDGSVDLGALPEPGDDAWVTRGYEPPVGETEQVLAGIWAEVLGMERVGRHDNFFENGGQSLLAVRVLSRVRDALGRDLPPQVLFLCPVLADFAAMVERTPPSAFSEIETVERDGDLPLSFAQQRLWFLEQLGNLGGTYHIPRGFRLRGALDRDALLRALDTLVARHEALRTTFALEDGAPVQRIAPALEGGFALAEHDLRGDAAAEETLARLTAEEAVAPFDLEHGPLLRGRLVRMAEDDHVLLVTMHHIVSDGWSLGVFSRELGALYAAFRAGQPDPLLPLPVQYADYAVWQRGFVEGDVLEAQASYWREALAGAPALLELPTDRPRPLRMDHRGGSVSLEFDAALTEGLRSLGRRHGTTLFMTLLAGWATVLSRLSGQRDVVIGAPTANRGRREIEGLIGFFVNTLALRFDLSARPTVAQLLAQAKVGTLGAQRNQDIPFERVVEIADPVRNLAHTPLFQVMFTWHNNDGAPLELPGVEAAALPAVSGTTAKFDLDLSLEEGNDRISGRLEYATALFDEATVLRHVGYFRRVLEQMVADDTLRVDELALLSDGERRQVVEEWNATDSPFPGHRCVHELFERQVERTPHAVAAEFEGESLTYAELNARANRLAHHLAGMGVGPDVPVAVCMERSLEMVVALLAVIKAGGAYVPMDPGYPDERLQYMLADSAPALLLTHGSLPERFADATLPLVRVDADAEAWADQAETNPARAVTPEHAAYVIYTSGSTGRPKGVVVPHRGLTHYATWAANTYAGGQASTFPLYSSIAFDLTVTSIYVPLITGGTIVVYREGEASDLPVLRVIGEDRVDVAKLTPAHLALLQQGDEETRRLGALILGGEDLKTAVAEAAQRALGGAEIYNEYGPTEATVGCMIHRFDAERDRAASVPIGRPIANSRIYVLDASGEPVPVGVTGEIHIGGVQLARGYLNRPELTAERFVPDAFSGKVGARLYRTGDLARWRADGMLEYLGRNDFQVKIRGFRIELGEIEARLADHPDVREAVVVAREDSPGDKRLVAYYAGPEIGIDELRAHLAGLPEHMVPAAYVRLEALPLTQNGKVDRRALPAPGADAYARRAYEPPVGETEETLAEIWAEVLGVERVGRHDNFFELGGHSLLVVTLIARMRPHGLHADIPALFTAPTLAELAALVSGESAEVVVPANAIPAGCDRIRPEMLPLVELSQGEIDRIVAGVEGGAANVQDIYPLAPLQEGILFHHLLSHGDDDPYLLVSLLGFAGRERLDAYLGALRAIIARHDIFRTGVVWEGLREPVQVVWRSADLPVDEIQLDGAEGDAAGRLWASSLRQSRIDVRRAPMLHAYIAQDGEGGWLLLLRMHHLVSDHTTLEVLQAEVQAHLLGRAGELPAPLPFRNFVAQARAGLTPAEHERFFREMLADVAEPTAPFGLMDVLSDGSETHEAERHLDSDLALRLRARARALGVSAASLFHVAWAQVLSRASGQPDVVFGTLLFGRMQGGEGADRVLGVFINTLPVRVRVDGQGVEDAVRDTHRTLARLLRHEHASLALAQRCSGVQAPTPLFTTLLNYRHGYGDGGSGGIRVDEAESRQAWDGIRMLRGEERTNYPLTLSVDDWGEGFTLTPQVDVSIDPARISELMHAALERLVDALETAPETAVAAVDVLPESERRLVVDAWNRREMAPARERCAPDLFEEHAARAPEAIAVVAGEVELTYGELNRRANRLAHHLAARGVGPDVRVALCVERGAEMMVALLGVLKAGGAYVPLDPSHPAERIAAVLQDAAPALVLTQSHLADALAGFGVPLVDLSAPEAFAGEPDVNPARAGLTPRHVAYVIYTSGSTGTPKGVMVEHRSLCMQVEGLQAGLGIGPGDRVLQFAPVTFDASVEQIFGAILSGAASVLRSDAWLESAETFWARCERHGVTVTDLPVRFWQLLVGEEGVAIPPCVRLVETGGEAVEPAMLAAWFRRGGYLPELRNLYGPTEATVNATLQEVTRDPQSWRSIGRPVLHARVYVLDEQGRPAPVGVAGEIHVGGGQVARGYLNRPELTAEKFVADPFSGEPGARLYRTGDLARWRADGTLEFLGRTDFQVKIRGFRIELGEIEAKLADHPDVRETVVVAREDAPGEKRLVAYWAGEGEVDAAALREHLAARLPEYMVPAAFVRLEALPMTPSGKADRKALPAPESDAWSTREFVAPMGETEEALAEIWAEVLGVDRVGRNDHFFELGGHSLLAVQAITRVREALQAEIPLRALFERPVLADFTRALGDAVHTELARIEAVERGADLPLSFGQQRLWFLEQFGGLGSAYQMRWRRRLRGALDRDALVRALDALVARHETLRTTFPRVDGAPVQRIAPAAESRFPLVEIDLTRDAGAEDALVRVLAEEATARFDLEQGPLVRGRLIRMAPDDHVLLVTVHHIIFDGWSSDVFGRELGALYAAFRAGEPNPLSPLPIQYADYAAWQRRWIEGEVLETQAAYWQRKLAGAPALLELPTDRPRPARMDHAGASVWVELDEELTAGLKALSLRHGTTLFMTLLAGWAATLGRLSGQGDVVVGSPSADRGRREVEGLIGFFVNTLALRVDLSDTPTVAELLRQVKAATLEAQQNQDIPFERVVELVDPVRSLAHTPLFQVMFVWQTNDLGTTELPGLEPAPLPSVSGATAKFDLALSLEEGASRIAGELQYATALFDEATVVRYLGYLRRVLRQMVADDRLRVDELTLLSDAERREVVEEWNATEAEYASDACIHQLFERQAERTPDVVAVEFEGETITYGELNRRANRLAHDLAARGVGPDGRVAICMERSLETVVALLGVLKAGGAYVPLDPAYPEDRLRFMLADSAPAAVVTHAGQRVAAESLFAEMEIPVVALGGGAEANGPDWDPQPAGLTPDHLAYVIYTSGSTGHPKGVLVPHRGVVNFFGWMRKVWVTSPDDRILQRWPVAFDASVPAFFVPLLAGARLVLPREREAMDPSELIDLVARHGITSLGVVPELLRALLRHPRFGELASLRNVNCAGDALPAELAEEFRGRLGVSLRNMYGATEASIVSTSILYEAGNSGAIVPIGRPLDNNRVYVLDRRGDPVPAGVPGEVYIGGVQVARGYLNRPELTAERFVPDPFGREPGARLYRTGDLGRWRADGALDFLGRADFQVKIRGFRVELGEIQSRLLEHPSVCEAVVIARRDGPGDQRLVAYCVGAEDVDVAALRAHLAARLPEHMVPAAYVWLDHIPLGSSGKVDRRALPAPAEDAYARRAYEPPVGTTEEVLAGIWCEVLGTERVGRHDSFFDLGGHSLLAVQVTSRVREALGAEVALRDVFERPVLSDFARAVDAAAHAELPAIEVAERESDLPLSFAQQRLWFLEQLGNLGSTYHVPRRRRLRGELDRDALVRALDALVARHEVLRTSFAQVDGAPVQRIASETRFALIEHDLTADPAAEETLAGLMEDEAEAPFDLEHGPLIRGRLIRMAADDHVLLITMHHIVSDGWSSGVFSRELGALYAAFRAGGENPLPPLPIQYADYAVWQRRWIEGEVIEAQASYWRQALAGAPALLELPADRPRPARMDHTGASVRVELDETLTAALKALSRRHGTTLYMTLLAGWAAVLSRLSGQADVVVGSPSANRGRREIEGLIGFFVNTLALRVDVSGSPTVAELLGRVKARSLGAQANQDIPFERVVEVVDPARSVAHAPLFQVMLSLQNNPGGALEFPGLEMQQLPGTSAVMAKFDLSLSLEEESGRIEGELEYATALFDEGTVRRYAGYLRRALQQMAADDTLRVDELALLSGAERSFVVDEWNATEMEYPREATIHELVERQAERTPDAVALVFHDDEVTYAELNRRANRVAHHLAARGVGPDVRVAVCLERSPEMVVAMLGVLKAGGAYVPLDPAYPEDRLRYMLEDSAPACVLADAAQRGTMADLVAGLDVPVLSIGEAADGPESNPARAGVGPENLAYVIYTSGSTGRPKGVMNTHGNVVQRVSWAQAAWRLGQDETMLSHTTLSFDGSIRELVWPLTVGARIVLAEGARPDPEALVRLMRREGVTALNAVPALLQLLVDRPEVASLARVRRVLCGGDVLPGSLLARSRERLSGATIHNLYGPSEAATAVAALDCGGMTDARVPIGRPMANSRTYLLDRSGQPVPVGVAGELYIGGASVARGYLGRAALTAERFVPDPFGREPGARLYRTGDLARWRPDGMLEFLGRNDFQVKVRGFRVELGEIEARLAEHPSVREAVVAAREDAPGDQRLVAYYLGADAGAEALRAHLGERLPEHMVPAAYVRLESLPLTPTGKLDRRALPAPAEDAYARRAYEAPVSEAEAAVAAIWAELLGVERVGRNDGFFELGGHSLLAVQVISRVREALGTEVSLLDLFERPVLADFARGAESSRRSALPAITPRVHGVHPPLSYAQQRMWFLDSLGADAWAYRIFHATRLRGELDEVALERALARIVARHEALRTRFVQVDGVPRQRIASVEEHAFALELDDLQGVEDVDGALQLAMAAESTAPLDLEHGPLFRARLVRLAADEHVLLVTLHHIVFDGWSSGVFHRELGELYAAYRAGRPDPLPPLPIQYADYAVWQRRALDDATLEAQARWWTETLQGVPAVLTLPTDRPRPERPDFAGAVLRGIELDETLTAGLKALSRRHGTTMYMTLLAGWATVLSRLAGQEDVVVGTPTANRGQREIEGLIGFFVNTLALRVGVGGSPTVADLLKQVKATTLGAQQNGDIPFERVVELVDPVRSLAHNPLFQVMFTVQNNPGGPLELPELDASPVGGEAAATARYDLALTLSEVEGRMRGVLLYATALFDEETVRRYVGYLRRVLEQMVADDAQPVAALALADEGERARVVEEWNRTDSAYEGGLCIHELFERQVERTPDAVAVVFEDESLTYAELNRRANRVAHHLRALGVGPDARVAVCMERSAEMPVALFGVLKAGGAYVPLDPDYPSDRLRYMLADSAPAAVLTKTRQRDGLASIFEGLEMPVVAVDGDLPAGPETNPARMGSPANLAYVIYTSGSTGKPKGVMNTHANVANALAWAQETWALGGGDAMLQRMSSSFDVSVREFFWPLTVGARLVVVRPEGHRDPAHLVELIRRAGVTTATFPPSMLLEFLEHPDVAGCTSLRQVLSGGEPLPAGLMGRLRSRLPGVTLDHMYGPTEATVAVTRRRPVEGEAVGASLGRPTPNCRIYVLDERGAPAPVGVTGEILIGGVQVARGYLDRPALTAERFVPDPFAGGGARLYRTGDLGRWRADGTLEFQGRADFQVKIRGFRVELGEIEAKLAAHPAVREAVVAAREDEPGLQRLVAYYVGPEVGAEVLRTHLGEQLPEYMVPAAYVRLERLPLTTSGKVDRRALPAPDADAYARRAWEAPEGETEELLAEIWAEVLGVARVGRNDDFFELGGHSLLVVRVATRIRDEVGVDLGMREIFEAPVLATLAERVVDAQLAQFDPEELARLAEAAGESFSFPSA
ncbi:MAG TPA: non-ribosomal peptide synthase/polyketide synthase [Longimicrobium sp.]